jgi:hypothetical protein
MGIGSGYGSDSDGRGGLGYEITNGIKLSRSRY